MSPRSLAKPSPAPSPRPAPRRRFHPPAARGGNTMALSAEQIADALSEYRDLPRIERERYRKKQWRVIEPGTAKGDYHGLTRQDWWLDSFLATDGEWVEISLIRAKHRGHGAFSKLLHRLEDDLH